MPEELNLVRDLAVILIAAGVFTIISRALKQPLVLGYIAAGLLVGPHIDFFPGISSQEVVQEWSEIGVIFLMFTLGLEFSFKKLLKVGSSALTVAGCKFIGVFVLGFLVGKALGWTTMESTFLGGLLSMSSTAVVIKAYDDMGLKGRPYSQLVFGTLVIEDLIAILLMVLLSTMAVSSHFSGTEMLKGLGKLAFFLVLWFLGGIYLIPTLLTMARKYLNDEILLIVSIGLCFGMVTLATSAGFSSALGAFVMGSILAETVESEHISKLVGGIKNLFSAIFFVSVGMMIDPAVIGHNWAVILLLAVVVIVSHIVFSAIGGIASGQGLSNSIHTGFSLAQLGEFGFIIAGVGMNLGVMRDSIYPIIVSVSVLTTFTTPYMIRWSDGAASWVERKMPDKWLAIVEKSRRSSSASGSERSEWIAFLKSWGLRVGLYSVLLIAIMTGSKLYLEPFVGDMLDSWSPGFRNALCVGATLLVMAPFLYGIAIGQVNKKAASKLIGEKESNALPLLGMVLLQVFIAISFILILLASHFNMAGWTVLAIGFGVLVFILIGRRSVNKFNAIEKRFLDNLNAKEEFARKAAPVTSSFKKEFTDYDVHVVSVTVPQESAFAGKKLCEIPIRTDTGANVVKIRRGKLNINIPSGNETVYPNDQILAAGTTVQTEAFRRLIEGATLEKKEGDENFSILPLTLKNGSALVGKTLHTLRLRDYGVMVVSVLHEGDMMTNPSPDYRFEVGDMVWIAGEKSSCDWFKR